MDQFSLGQSAFQVLAKPTGPLCNLDCRYCYYLEKEKLYPGTKQWAMPEGVLESFIRQYIEAQDVPVASFVWQGGEPTLLGVEYFRKAAELQKRFAAGKRVENAFQTNGVLLDDEWCRFLAEEGFLVGVSIDGPRSLHDGFRVDRGSRPTFDRVMRGIELLKKHGVEYNTLTVVHRRNSSEPQAVYRFLKEIGSGHIQFIPAVERIASTPGPDGLVLIAPGVGAEAEVAEWSVEPLQYGKFLCDVFDEWVCRDVSRQFVQIFEVALGSWLALPQALCVFRETCGSALAIEHNGDLFSCDHYVYPENRLGNILESPLRSLVKVEQQRRFGRDKRDTLPGCCRRCEVRFACNGECPKHRFLESPDGEPGWNYLCAGYKRFFKHIDPYMRFMAAELRQGRPADGVMTWARLRAFRKTAGRPPGRNSPCPCGSGKKFKKCCDPGRLPPIGVPARGFPPEV